MYISVYQLIKNHIETGTNYGKRLLTTKKTKGIDVRVTETTGKDDFLEEEYSAVHFDLDLVVELV